MGKLASLYPDHLWVYSNRGSDRGLWWILEALKRDPDEFNMHIYSDSAAYGGFEVLENIVIISSPASGAKG